MSLGLEPCISDAGLKTSKSELCRSVRTSKGKTQSACESLRPFHEGSREPAGFRIVSGSAAWLTGLA